MWLMETGHVGVANQPLLLNRTCNIHDLNYKPSNFIWEIFMLSAYRLALVVLLTGLIASSGLSSTAFAQETLPSAQGHEESMKVPAGKFIQNLGDKVIGIVADKKITPQVRTDQFREILRTAFDLQTIGRFVIGRTWNSATPAQQAEYMSSFEQLVIKNYGNQISLYSGEGFTVKSVRGESEKDSVVNALIVHPDGSQPTSVDWRVRQRDGKLGVIDVVVEGVSLSVTQRQEYAAVIQHNDGQIDGLLKIMREQIQKADSGDDK